MGAGEKYLSFLNGGMASTATVARMPLHANANTFPHSTFYVPVVPFVLDDVSVLNMSKEVKSV